jgi:tetratricopeptide (TPR) repeat protein
MTARFPRGNIQLVNYRGLSYLSRLLLALALPANLKAAELAASPTLPTLQLTVQPARFLDHDNFVANLLLRELQRQAVLIAARDELGLATRDMVLREPFNPHGIDGVSTVLFESRVWRGEQAQICVSRFDGKQPAGGYALADLQVDDPRNSCIHWASFKISADRLVNYPEFVTRCEKASREDYRTAVLAENVLGDFSPHPVQWVASGDPGTVDPVALRHLQQMDVFSQYLAAQGLHGQMRTQGASVDRLTALVRVYANLAALTSSQWSQTNKAFMARSLLYAERLVVHENGSGAALQARAYARAFAGLHAAALDDLDAAKKAGSSESGWVSLIRAYCMYDPDQMDRANSLGSWKDRPLAAYLGAVVAADGFTADVAQDALDAALDPYPEMFNLAPWLSLPVAAGQKQPDQLVNAIPVVLKLRLQSEKLPTGAQAMLRQLKPGTDSYRQLAMLRDRLNAAAAVLPADGCEPSLGVLADLIEQQEMVGLVRWTAAMLHDSDQGRQINSPAPAVQTVTQTVSAAMPILKAHPWGSYVEALSITNANANRQNQPLAKIKDRNFGGWVNEAMSHLQAESRETGELEKKWLWPADLYADALVTDYSPQMGVDRAPDHYEDYLRRLRKTSPHSAVLTEAWMRSIPLERLDQEKRMYDSAVDAAENEFSERPGVLRISCDWCNQVGDWERSLALLNRLNDLQPSSEVSALTARVLHRQGRTDEAIATALRGTNLSDYSWSYAPLYHMAADFLIEEHRYSDAITCVQRASDSDSNQSPMVLGVMARCYELMGQMDDADECFRQLDLAVPAFIGEHYLWARRVGRHDANALRAKAAAYVHQPNDPIDLGWVVYLVNDQEQRALNQVRGHGAENMLDAPQTLILATRLHDPVAKKRALDQMSRMYGNSRSFLLAFAALAQATDMRTATAVFDAWMTRQLDEEGPVDWCSLAGRYLVAAGHVAEGKAYLIRAIQQPTREKVNYYLAWRELQKLGDDPQALLKPATQP